MNTRLLLDTAKAERLSPMGMQAHILWALISQSGRPPMTVGEIAKVVKQTSGITPSAYQVRSVCERLSVSDTVFRQVLRNTGVASVIGYTAGENAVLMLSAFVHEFVLIPVLYDAISTAVWPVRRQAIDVSNSIYNYNQEMDEAAKVSGEKTDD